MKPTPTSQSLGLQGMIEPNQHPSEQITRLALERLAATSLFLELVRERDRGHEDGLRGGTPLWAQLRELCVDYASETFKVALARGADDLELLATDPKLDCSSRMHEEGSIPSLALVR